MSKVLKVAQFVLNFVLVLGALSACSALIWLLEKWLGVNAIFAISAFSVVALWAHFCPLVTLREDS